MTRVEEVARTIAGVRHTVGISGPSLLVPANGPTLGWLYVMHDDFKSRRSASLKGNAIAAQLNEKLHREIREASVSVYGAPPVDGLGNAGGFKLVVEDRANAGLNALQKVGDAIVAKGAEAPRLRGLFNSSRADTPWIHLEIDRAKCMALRLPVKDVFDTLQVNFGSYYVNNFKQFGRSWQVNVMADTPFRDRVQDILKLEVRNKDGKMIPLGTVVDIKDRSGPSMVTRYNMYAAAVINGDTAPGTSSGAGVKIMEQIADTTVPPPLGYEWTELSALLQLEAKNVAMSVFGLSVLFVFLVLAAQYESWKPAVGGDPGRADVPALLDHAGVAVRADGRQCLHRQIGFIKCWWGWRARTRS